MQTLRAPNVVDTSANTKSRSVSFNRDVHVKRFGGREKNKTIPAVAGGGVSRSNADEVIVPVRRESLSRDQLQREAARVLRQVDTLRCVVTQPKNNPSTRFYTLPVRLKSRQRINLELLDPPTVQQATLQTPRRKSEDLNVDSVNTDVKKQPKVTNSEQKAKKNSQVTHSKSFKENDNPKSKAVLKRRKSDTSDLKSKYVNDRNIKRKNHNSENKIKSRFPQLSPIIEASPPVFEENKTDDYFSLKENKDLSNTKYSDNSSIVESLNRSNYNSSREEPAFIIIDVDKAEKIDNQKNRKRNLTKVIKSLTKRVQKRKDKKPSVNEVKITKNNEEIKNINKENEKNHPKINIIRNNNIGKNNLDEKDNKYFKETDIARDHNKNINEETSFYKTNDSIDSVDSSSVVIEDNKNIKEEEEMMHSSQKPTDRIPLTRGYKVDSMVRRLSKETYSPPPKTTNILITPTSGMQHNNNQPFSYTKQSSVSPDRFQSSFNSSNGLTYSTMYRKHNESFSGYKTPEYKRSPSPNVDRFSTDKVDKSTNEIIYAQVVCGNKSNGEQKQTVHKSYTSDTNKVMLHNSDSDEGLGYEDFGTDKNLKTHHKTIHSEYKDEIIDETPIRSKIINNYNKYNGTYDDNYEKTFLTETSILRGRADGMDSKRHDSFTEDFVNSTIVSENSNRKSNLSSRREVLESKINSRNRNLINKSYDHPSAKVNDMFSSKYTKYSYNDSPSPTITRKYLSEPKIVHEDESKVRSHYEINSNRKMFLDSQLDSEPQSFDSQISNYKSSPENMHKQYKRTYHSEFTTSYPTNHASKYQSHASKLSGSKEKDYHRSNPELVVRQNEEKYKDTKYDNNSYHSSLRREKKHGVQRKVIENSIHMSREQLENDIRKKYNGDYDSPKFRQDYPENTEYSNDSEDEGFASSLLIPNDKQNVEETVRERVVKKTYEDVKKRGREYKNVEKMEVKKRNEFIPRERSIDDGSHYDPRIDKDLSVSGTLKKVDKKPPKVEKKVGNLDKVKQLFTLRKNKDKRKQTNEKMMVQEEEVRARYSEYKGSSENIDSTDEKFLNRKLTPYEESPVSVRRIEKVSQAKKTTEGSEINNNGWFKSLDRLGRKNKHKIANKNDDNKSNNVSLVDEKVHENAKLPPKPLKNLRFFGDTDIESGDSIRQKSVPKYRPVVRSSTLARDGMRSKNYADERSDILLNSKAELKHKEAKKRDSIASSTEGDSSQQSQKSVVYLHAATVGDIPGRIGVRHATSKDDLQSSGGISSPGERTRVKTLSRSFSVLAPWKPRLRPEHNEVEYPPTLPHKYSKHRSKHGPSSISSTSINAKIEDKQRSKNERLKRNSESTSNLKKAYSKERISQTLNRPKDNNSVKESSTLYKKKDSHYGDKRKPTSNSISMENLGSSHTYRKIKKDDKRDRISRSISMPKDSNKSAGWFGKSKK